jgi:hypothetical protein
MLLEPQFRARRWGVIMGGGLGVGELGVGSWGLGCRGGMNDVGRLGWRIKSLEAANEEG